MPESVKRFQMLFDDVEVTDPLNWPSFTPEESIHRVYKTIFVQFTEQRVVLIKDAKTAADAAYDENGVAANIEVKWKEWNSSTQSYDTVYNIGKLSFKPGHYRRLREKTEVKFEPAGFITQLLARDEIKSNLQELTDMEGGAITQFTNETQSIELDAQTLISYYEREEEFQLYHDTIENQYTPDGEKYYLGIDQVTLFDPIRNEIDEVNSVAFNLENDVAGVEKIIEPGEGTFGGTFDVEYNIDVFLIIQPYQNTWQFTNLTGVFRLVFEIFNDDDSSYQRFVIDTVSFDETHSATDGLTNPYNIEENISGSYEGPSITISNGRYAKFFIEAEIVESDTLDSLLTDKKYQYYTPQLDITITKTSVLPATTAEVMLPWEYFLRICQKITGRNDCLRSPLFGRTDGEVYTYSEDGEQSLCAITNVKQVRSFPLSKGPIKSSLREGYKVYDALFMLGLGITYESGVPYILIDKLENFYDSGTIVMTLSAEDPGINWEPALNYVWGTVKSGFRNFKNKSNFTLNSPHSTREYSISGLDHLISKQYNAECEAILSGHLIEDFREQSYLTASKKDLDSLDEKLVIIHVKRSEGGGFERVKAENFNNVTNLDNSSTQYNLELTPARVLMNHAPMLLAGLNRSIGSSGQNQFLKFQSGEANTDVTTQLTGESATIEEGGDIDRDMLPAGKDVPLFDASFLGTFTAKLTKAQRALFRDGFTGMIQVQDADSVYLGFYAGKRDMDLVNQKSEIKILRKSNVGYIQYLGTDENIEYLGSDGGQPIPWLGN